MKGAVSAQKALQGSKTETRELLGRTEVNNALPDKRSMICPPGISMFFLPICLTKYLIACNTPGTYHSKSYCVKVYLGFEGVDPGPKSRPVIFVVVAVSIGCQIHSLLLISSPQVCFDNQLFGGEVLRDDLGGCRFKTSCQPGKKGGQFYFQCSLFSKSFIGIRVSI